MNQVNQLHEAKKSASQKGVQSKRGKNLLIIAIMGVIAIGGYNLKGYLLAKEGGWAYPPAKVALFDAQYYQLPNLFEGVGELEAINEVWIASEVSGRVESINFESGEVVQKGQLLVQLNDQREKSERARLVAERHYIETQVKRYERLVKEKAVDVSKYDEAYSQLMQIDASLANIDAAIAEKAIRAPFSGTIGIKQVHLGDIINPGQKLTTLVDGSEFRANFTLDEKYAEFLTVDQPAELYISALNRSYPAKVSAIDPLISNARLISVQATVIARNSAEKDIAEIYPELKSGMFVKAFVEGEAIDALLIPETALTYTIYGSSVLVMQKNEDGSEQVKAVRVEIGEKQRGFVEITKGINAGEKVVISGQHKLGDGAFVEVVESDTLSFEVPQFAISNMATQ
ncbi:efflux RND transporter periplasmic adaptor subunit [Ignatzschineria rhizosphaerae]|uniref:Efflux RND transporter periplasmic adaptor subunit n=1 Tax=Ignatzschineria rhizosphaerae TaxID=2923279 RepID=A0ABY3X9D0_9GAMM|nr:efflux RND transporter periplasmic adaptor subunit [Ignatzschineria rhizosphaerae]UNM97350.1 efflux RND transporter periplasmic adaptor subunit [Ignatzschineria rhizosphaerae]